MGNVVFHRNQNCHNCVYVHSRDQTQDLGLYFSEEWNIPVKSSYPS